MTWVTIVWPMIAAACLTLAAMHLLAWTNDRRCRTSLLFAAVATSVAAMTAFELALMRAQTPAAFGTLLRWANVPVFFIIVSTVAFVRAYFGTGRPWLGWAVCAMRLVSLIVNFVQVPNIHYTQITALQHPLFLGVPIAVAEGIGSPWSRLAEGSTLLLAVFVFDASLALWRRGGAEERRRAAVVGGAMVVFLVQAVGLAVLVRAQLLQAPYLVSVSFLVVVAAMNYEMSRDVIQAAKLARALRESEQRLDLAANAVSLGVWTWDVIRDDIWAPVNTRALLGLSASDRLTLDQFMAPLHPDDRESERRAIERSVGGGGDYQGDYRVQLADGTARWVASRGRTEFGSDGAPAILRGVTLDITALRRSELETRELRQGLAHAGRLRTMGQLTAALAHELYQPVGAILRNAEAAEQLLQSESPDLDELRSIVSDIHKDDQRASDVIDRLRAMLTRRSVQTEVLGIRTVVDEVISIVRFDAAKRHVSLDIDVPADLPAVSGDRVHLQQVLLNLIVNAMEATSGTSKDARRVSICARCCPNGEIETAVSDSGPGIAGGQIDQIFAPFFTTKSHGMGMGLPVSRTIIEAHGGRMWAENNRDGGATFRVVLPSAAEGLGT